VAEYWDVYDRGRRPLGKLHQRGTAMAQGEYHIVVQIWIRDDAGNFLVSQRHPDKPWPLFMETVQGSVTAGEDSLTGARRELAEEIGIEANADQLRLAGTICDERNTFYDVYEMRWNGGISELTFQETEVVDAKWVDFDGLCAIDDAENLVPTLRYFRRWFAPPTSA